MEDSALMFYLEIFHIYSINITTAAEKQLNKKKQIWIIHFQKSFTEKMINVDVDPWGQSELLHLLCWM